MAASDPCPRCGHLWYEHVLVTYDDILKGGAYYCPDPDCDCEGTWGVDLPEPRQ